MLPGGSNNRANTFVHRMGHSQGSVTLTFVEALAQFV
jgi:hypothetical protein